MSDAAWFSSTSIGVDEAGRGCLAGPVVAAAVLLHPDRVPTGITDSKAIGPEQRLELSTLIKQHALAWSVSFVDHATIDAINILQATYQAMHACIDDVCAQLAEQHLHPNILLIDGNRFRPHRIPSTCIVKGDALNVVIGAASILAKVARDQWMIDVADVQYPDYGFARHKGYGTVYHREAIKQRGACPIHRQTFLSNILAEQ
jgi:ribonuclease HII